MAHSNREKRKAARLAQKRARKAEWASLIGTSRNKKLAKNTGSKRRPPMAKVQQSILKVWQGRTVASNGMVHQGPKCFNVGCKRCSPIWRIT